MDDRRQLDRWLLRNPLPGPSTTKEERRAYFDRMPSTVKREWEIKKNIKDIEQPGYNAATVERAQERMARVDKFPAEIRAMVYEHGLELVQEFWNHGVRTAKSIDHLICACRNERPDGRNFFRPNVRPNAKQNPANLDDDEYYVIAQR